MCRKIDWKCAWLGEWMNVKSGFEAYISIDLYLLTPTEHSTSSRPTVQYSTQNSIPDCNTPEEQWRRGMDLRKTPLRATVCQVAIAPSSSEHHHHPPPLPPGQEPAPCPGSGLHRLHSSVGTRWSRRASSTAPSPTKSSSWRTKMLENKDKWWRRDVLYVQCVFIVYI